MRNAPTAAGFGRGGGVVEMRSCPDLQTPARVYVGHVTTVTLYVGECETDGVPTAAACGGNGDCSRTSSNLRHRPKPKPKEKLLQEMVHNLVVARHFKKKRASYQGSVLGAPVL